MACINSNESNRDMKKESRLLGVCRIVIFAESEYSAEYSALPNNEENMFKNNKRQKILGYSLKLLKGPFD